MAEPSRPDRIWYQSFVHIRVKHKHLILDRLQAYLDMGLPSPEQTINSEVHGLDPPDRHFHPLTEFRCAAQIHAQCA